MQKVEGSNPFSRFQKASICRSSSCASRLVRLRRRVSRLSASACPAGTVRGVIDETQLREAGRRLAEAAPGARVILFGSHARGTAAERSDIDILVIEREVENAALESVRLMRELRDLRLPVEVVVVSERDAAAWRDVRGSLVHAAITEGRVLAA
jgi:predicted nucleotidyltransferase